MKLAGLATTCGLRLIVLGLMATLILPRPLLAQASVAVTGVVLDESGAPIPGTSVALIGRDPGETHNTVSKQDGSFTIEHVAPASYTLKIELSGFETYQKATPVGPDQPNAVRVTLRLARVEQEVTVEADSGDQVSTSSSNTATLRLENDQLLNLPVASDDVFSLIGRFISPAAQGAAGASIVVDGVEGGQIDVPSSAIDKLRINRNPYSAEFQHPGNGRLEVSTRRGHRSRRLDGGFDMSARNSFLAARNAFAKSDPSLDRHLFQPTAGGSLGRKASFNLAAKRFVNEESAVVNAVTLAGPVVANVPTFQRHDSLFARLQWWPRALQTIYATYNYSDQPSRNRGSGGFNLPERGFNTHKRKQKITLNQELLLPPNWSNRLVFSASAEEDREGDPAAAPAIVVNQAFAAGPSQSYTDDTKRSLNVENTTRYFGRRAHTVLFGGRFRTDRVDAFDASNFGGTFEFGSLSDFAAGTPLNFRINRGDPNASFRVYEANGFVQDEIRVKPKLTLTVGLRYDWQSTTAGRDNLAPRFAWAFIPQESKKTVFRGGVGIFYDNLPRSATERSLLFDGTRLTETVISGPSFPNPFGSGQAVSPPPSTIRVATGIRSPHLTQAGVGVERELPRRNRLMAEYTASHGVNQFRSLNINAPLPATGLRPDPSFLNINQVESTGSQRSQALTVTWVGRVGKAFRPYTQYVLSKTTNDTSGTFSLPVSSFDVRPEIGPADFDQRHRFNLMGTLALPAAFQTGLVLSVGSGLPYTITTGFDDNRDTVVNDRPPGVTRNTGRGPRTVQLDFRIARNIDLGQLRGKEQTQKRDSLAFMMDVFNAINRTNVTGIVGARSSPFFGRANSAASARTVQFSIRYAFRR